MTPEAENIRCVTQSGSDQPARKKTTQVKIAIFGRTSWRCRQDESSTVRDEAENLLVINRIYLFTWLGSGLEGGTAGWTSLGQTFCVMPQIYRISCLW